MKIFFAILISMVVALRAGGEAMAAQISEFSFATSSAQMRLSGMCEESMMLRITSISTSTPIYTSGVGCDEGLFSFTDEMWRWKLAPGDYQATLSAISTSTAFDARAFTIEPPAPPSSSSSASEVQNAIEQTESSTVAEYPAIASSIEIVPNPSGQVGTGDFDSTLARFFNIFENWDGIAQKLIALVAEKIKATLVAAVKIFVRDLAFSPEGSITVPAGANQMAGRAMIPLGAGEVFVRNARVQNETVVILTPLSSTPSPLVVLEKIPSQGFRAGLGGGAIADYDIPFDWILVQTYSVITVDSTPSVSISPALSESVESVAPAEFVSSAASSTSVP